MAAPAKHRRHSYLDVFGDRLPSRFPVPKEAPGGGGRVPSTHSYTGGRTDSGSSLRVPLRKRVRRFFTNVWDSRIAMKLFGSRKELEMEEERLQNIEYVVIHPCSKFRWGTTVYKHSCIAGRLQFCQQRIAVARPTLSLDVYINSLHLHVHSTYSFLYPLSLSLSLSLSRTCTHALTHCALSPSPGYSGI